MERFRNGNQNNKPEVTPGLETEAGAKPQKKKTRKDRIITGICIGIFVVGLAILLYPTFSNLYNKHVNRQLVTVYVNDVEEYTDEEIEKEFAEAEAYNKQHKVNTIRDAFDNDEYIMSHPYDDLLNPSGSGAMAYIEIPKISQTLVIYHGTGSEVLEEGVGHVEGTSLPIGGQSTHSVLAAHRGLPSAKLFTDIDQLEIGDQFYITALNRKLAYEVDQIEVVEPENTDYLAIEEGEDLVTLLTCTPYGVNTHRLLIRGHRFPYVEPDEDSVSSINWTILYIIIAVLIILLIIILLILRKKKKAKSSAKKLSE